MARTGGWRHLLIVGLIALAVAVAVGVAVSVRSSDLPDQVELAAEFGAADLRVSRHAEGVRFQDLPPELQRYVRHAGVPAGPDGERVDVEATVREVMPEAEVLRTANGYTYALGLGQVWLRSFDVTDPLAEGLVQVDGDAPGEGQALVSPVVLRAFDADVGETIQLPGHGEVEVTGTVHDPRQLRRPVVVLPSGVDLAAQRSETAWLVGVPGDLDREEVDRLRSAFDPGGQGQRPSDVGVRARFEHADMLRRGPREVTQTPTFVGSIVGVALLLQVALVSAAAFATGTRRRLRDLGLLGAVGASPEQVRRVVLREGAVLGTVGAVAGLLLGVVGASTLGVWIVQRFVGNPVTTVQLHPADLLVPTALGMFATAAAAYLPARTAGRVPVTTALAGRLPVSEVPRWITPTAIVTGIAGLVVLYATRQGTAAGDELTVGAGFLAATIGAASLGVPLLAVLGRLADRLPVRLRLAVRDTVRQRTRSGAAVAALTVVLVIPVIVAVAASTEAARWAGPEDLRRDVASISGPHFRGLQLPPTDQMIDQARGLLPPIEERIPVTRLISRTAPEGTGIAIRPVADPQAGRPQAIHPPAGAPFTSSFGAAAVATDELLAELGLTHLRRQIDDGAVVVLGMHNIVRQRPLQDGPAELIVTTGGRPVASTSPGDSGSSPPATATVPLIVAEPEVATWDMPEILMSTQVAGRIGLVPVDGPVLLDLDRPIDIDLVHDLEQIGRAGMVPFTVAGSLTAFRPSPAGTIALAIGIALAVALIISGMTAALAATESDHDLELITAVGSVPAIRRHFHGWQAGYHALLAAVLAVPTGLAIFRAGAVRTLDQAWMEVPWGWLAMAVLVVPLLVGVTHAGLMRSARLRAPRRIA